MIYVATVHHLKSDWVEIQRRYLDRFIASPFRVYASLEGISEDFHDHFDVVVPSMGGHAGKLNHLAEVIGRDAAPDDQIWFTDGDAFPIADPVEPVDRMLGRAPLAAVCRLENDGDRQPHPCFCAVTVGEWQRLRGDWSGGFCYRPGRTDVGANLLYRLESTGTPWERILRSNGGDLHPVFFGIYGGFWYHHGAGFRDIKATRGDRTKAEEPKQTLQRELRVKRLREHLGDDGLNAMVERAFRNAELSDKVMARIREDGSFFVDLQ
jgi:hypothetical protein